MGGYYATWRLTRPLDSAYYQAPSPVPAVSRLAAVNGAAFSSRKVSNTVVAAEVELHAPAVTRWVVFVCGGRQFGFPLDCAIEIVAPRPLTRLPGTGPEVCGIAGVRGRVLTVFDLGVVLGLPAASLGPDHRLLIIDLDGRRVGAAVDEVVTIVSSAVQQDRAGSMDAVRAGPVADAAAAAGSLDQAVAGTGTCDAGDFTALLPELLLNPLLR
jgi:chemotaxis signal transduction protein